MVSNVIYILAMMAFCGNFNKLLFMYITVMKFLLFLILFFFNLSSFSSLSASETICGESKNITYYSETDEYYSLIGPEKYLADLENVLNNFEPAIFIDTILTPLIKKPIKPDTLATLK